MMHGYTNLNIHYLAHDVSKNLIIVRASSLEHRLGYEKCTYKKLRWKVTPVWTNLVDFAIEDPVLSACSRFVSMAVGKGGNHWIVLIDTKGHVRKIVRPNDLLWQEISGDGKHLFMVTQSWLTKHLTQTSTIVYETSTGKRSAFPGWVISSSNKSFDYVDKNRNLHHYSFSSKKDSVDDYLSIRLQALLHFRDTAAGDSDDWRLREFSAGQNTEIQLQRQVIFSKNLQWMLQLVHKDLGEPGFPNPHVATNERVAASVLNISRRLVWSIQYREYSPLQAVQKISNSGDFLFMTFEHVQMGKEKLNTYPIGLFCVNPLTGRCVKLPLPPYQSSNWYPAVAIETE